MAADQTHWAQTGASGRANGSKRESSKNQVWRDIQDSHSHQNSPSGDSTCQQSNRQEQNPSREDGAKCLPRLPCARGLGSAHQPLSLAESWHYTKSLQLRQQPEQKGIHQPPGDPGPAGCTHTHSLFHNNHILF